jgi:hypothetical protein
MSHMKKKMKKVLKRKYKGRKNKRKKGKKGKKKKKINRQAGQYLPAGWKIPVELGWYLPWRKISLDENRFLQPGKGPKNTKEKTGQCFS